MSLTVTVIADKDIGAVLGGVTETSAEDALKVEQVVAEAGFPLRKESAVTMEVPRSELTTAAATGLGAVTEPQAYVLKDGVPTTVGTGMTISKVVLNPGDIVITVTTAPTGDLTVKAILQNLADDTVEIFRATKRTPSGKDFTIGASLQKPGSYHALILVEGHRAHYDEAVPVT